MALSEELKEEIKATVGEAMASAVAENPDTVDRKVTGGEDEERKTKEWKGGNPAGQGEAFVSLGENMTAIKAYQTGGEADGRLYGDPMAVKVPTGMGEMIDSDGGFLLQTEFSDQILTRMYETNVLAGRCTKMQIGTNAARLSIPAIDETSRVDGSRYGGVRAYWESEGASTTATKPAFRRLNIEPHKLMATFYVTDEMLADVAQLGGFAQRIFIEEIGFKLDDAIVNGTGAGQPVGIITASAAVSVAKETGQAAATIVYENVLKMRARLWAKSRPRAVWFINQDCEPQLSTMSLAVGTGGAPVYMPAGGAAADPNDRLFTLPVIPIEQCQTVGTAGDIILADLSQYLLVEKGSINSASSVHVRFLQDETTFRMTYRVNGQPMWDTALTPFKGSNTQSTIITLAVRS
jgi:HK97 family phage major capsid protein|tara:strand:+ start:9879 stop:11099 length:1221 start_codon:yes stop_codon:yes gene_type:complete